MRYIKKSIILLTVLCISLASFGCISATTEPDATLDPTPTPSLQGSSSKPIVAYKEVIDITWVRVADKSIDIDLLEYIMLNFGIRIKERNFPSRNMDEDILQMYSAGIYPELATGISVETAKLLAEKRCLAEVDEKTEKLADYFKLWENNPSGLEYTKKDIAVKNEKGEDKYYCIVPVNTTASRTWIYNKSLFESNSMKFPETVDELYTQLARYKKEHEASGVLWMNRYEPLQLTALLNAYGLTDDEWQTDKNGNVIYLYAQKEWYKALEWLTKFEEIGAVPVDGKGVLKGYTDEEYTAHTKNSEQIIEFTDSYNYMFVQATQKKESQWAVAPALIRADDATMPVISANLPYINEATCFSSDMSQAQLDQVLAFVNWCCTDSGNMWANFGRENIDYKINDDGTFEFLRYYSNEITPDMDKKKTEHISAVGRMYTVIPWEKISLPGIPNRYSAMTEFLQTAEYRLVYPERFGSIVDAVEDKTMLWQYDKISIRLKELSEEFVEYSRRNGFSDYYWSKYYDSLLEAGLEDYVALMNMRKK